jgi:hypothetical protein
MVKLLPNSQCLLQKLISRLKWPEHETALISSALVMNIMELYFHFVFDTGVTLLFFIYGQLLIIQGQIKHAPPN